MYYSKVEAVADEVHRMEVRTATATAVPGGLRAVGRRLLSPPAATAQQNQQDDWDEVQYPAQGGGGGATAAALSNATGAAAPKPAPGGGGNKAGGANGVAPGMVALEVDTAPQQQQQMGVGQGGPASKGPTANGSAPHQLAVSSAKQDAASEGKASSAAGEAPPASSAADISKDSGAGPGSRTLAQLREEAWQAVPLHRRMAYHVHMGIRILWLALMGDPSFYQDAMDLVGEPPGPGGPALRRALAAAGYWVRRTLLLLLSLVAGLSQVRGTQGKRGCASVCDAYQGSSCVFVNCSTTICYLLGSAACLQMPKRHADMGCVGACA
jgi:hypothetical protein